MRFSEFKVNEAGPLDSFYAKFMSLGKDVDGTDSGAAGAPAQAGATAASVGPQTKQRSPVGPNDVKSYLSSKGLDANQVAGIMANIQHESNFDSGAIGDNGTSGGLFQHHANRFSSMVAASGGDNKWQRNWQKQIDFALSEPAGRQYAGIKFRTPQEATKWWTVNFEIPQNKFAQANLRSRSATAYV